MVIKRKNRTIEINVNASFSSVISIRYSRLVAIRLKISGKLSGRITHYGELYNIDIHFGKITAA